MNDKEIFTTPLMMRMRKMMSFTLPMTAKTMKKMMKKRSNCYGK